jgi:RNA polymerase sigma-70 factor (ECF subfamily)
VAQEALLRAYRQWDVVGTYERPGAWSRRVALNLATSARRRRRSEQRAVVRLAFRPDPPDPDPVADPVVSADVWAVVRTLPRQQANALVLYYLADESVADLAASLGCAPGTAKAHLHQARAALAARLGTDEEVDP